MQKKRFNKSSYGLEVLGISQYYVLLALPTSVREVSTLSKVIMANLSVFEKVSTKQYFGQLHVKNVGHSLSISAHYQTG